jgi:Ca-activated chloride channel family protein
MKVQRAPTIPIRLFLGGALVSICLCWAFSGSAQQKPGTSDPLLPTASPSPQSKGQPPRPDKTPAAGDQLLPPASSSPAPQSPVQQPDRPVISQVRPEIVNADLISFNVTVTDGFGRFVSGLNKNAFSVFDEKQPQDILFFSDDDAPVSVAIVFDLTGSMSGDKVKRARTALSRFFDTSHDLDEYSLITLQSGRAYLMMGRTRDSKAILEGLTFVQTKGNTAFYDGVYLAAEHVQRGTHPKKAVLVISDGQDNNSRYTFGDLRKSLKESDVAIYCVGIEESGSGPLTLGGSAILDEIASVSGGKSFFPRTDAEMDDIFEQIAIELRHQYSIGYKPADFHPDGKWHHIKVKVNSPRGLPRLFVRSREGYFALANPR